jgi:hypothetical protein
MVAIKYVVYELDERAGLNRVPIGVNFRGEFKTEAEAELALHTHLEKYVMTGRHVILKEYRKG